MAPERSAPRARTRQYRSGDERRIEIVRAAIAIIAEQGLRELKTAELARRLGVSEATIFRHFGSMEEILVAAVRYEAALLRDRIEAFEGSGTPWERAEQLVLSLLDFFEETGGGPIVIVTGQVIRLSPEIREIAMKTIGLVRRRLAALANEAVGRERAAASGEQVANLLIAVIQSSALRWVMSERKWPMRANAEGMLEVLRQAVEAREGGVA
ncbi:MAG TPA: TetR/AcrR family transcriptional regulator [Gemmatimonadales bacterium]|nr:TetR/AcrR family transcriptional regulator [Gemmatimonadales bacterium]